MAGVSYNASVSGC